MLIPGCTFAALMLSAASHVLSLITPSSLSVTTRLPPLASTSALAEPLCKIGSILQWRALYSNKTSCLFGTHSTLLFLQSFQKAGFSLLPLPPFFLNGPIAREFHLLFMYVSLYTTELRTDKTGKLYNLLRWDGHEEVLPVHALPKTVSYSRPSHIRPSHIRPSHIRPVELSSAV